MKTSALLVLPMILIFLPPPAMADDQDECEGVPEDVNCIWDLVCLGSYTFDHETLAEVTSVDVKAAYEADDGIYTGVVIAAGGDGTWNGPHESFVFIGVITLCRKGPDSSLPVGVGTETGGLGWYQASIVVELLERDLVQEVIDLVCGDPC